MQEVQLRRDELPLRKRKIKNIKHCRRSVRAENRDVHIIYDNTINLLLLDNTEISLTVDHDLCNIYAVIFGNRLKRGIVQNWIACVPTVV